MKIIVVEDQLSKRRQICEAIDRTIPDVELVEVDCVNEAKMELKGQSFDLMILDICLPKRSGEAPQADGGLQLWKSVSESVVYKAPKIVIGITAYEDVAREVGPKLEYDAVTLIVRSSDSDEWIERLYKKLSYIWRSENDYKHEEGDNAVDVCVLTAVEVEFRALLDFDFEWEVFSGVEDLTNYRRGKFKRHDGTEGTLIAARAPQMGMPGCSTLAAQMIADFHPRFIGNIGIAAGVSGKVEFGDVLVGDPVFDWGSGKYLEEKGSRFFHPDPMPERADPDIVSFSQNLANERQVLFDIVNSWKGKKPNSLPRVICGPMASGSSVVADPSIVASIKATSRKLIGIEMETYGLYYTANHFRGLKSRPFSFKAVSDFANSKKSDEYHEYAAYMSASIFRYMLENFV